MESESKSKRKNPDKGKDRDDERKVKKVKKAKKVEKAKNDIQTRYLRIRFDGFEDEVGGVKTWAVRSLPGSWARFDRILKQEDGVQHSTKNLIFFLGQLGGVAEVDQIPAGQLCHYELLSCDDPKDDEDNDVDTIEVMSAFFGNETPRSTQDGFPDAVIVYTLEDDAFTIYERPTQDKDEAKRLARLNLFSRNGKDVSIGFADKVIPDFYSVKDDEFRVADDDLPDDLSVVFLVATETEGDEEADEEEDAEE